MGIWRGRVCYPLLENSRPCPGGMGHSWNGPYLGSVWELSLSQVTPVKLADVLPYTAR